MQDIKKNAIEALKKLQTSISSSIAGDNLLIDHYGWYAPAIKKSELNDQIEYIISSIDRIDEKTKIPDSLIDVIKSLPDRIQKIISNNITHIQNGNGGQAFPPLLSFIDWLFFSINPILSWTTLKNPNAMPKSLASRISAIDKRINEIEPEHKLLQEKIKTINDAYAAADELPESLETLRNTKSKANVAAEETARCEIQSKELKGKIEKIENSLEGSKQKAEAILAQCETALRASTSVGLAAAFEERARYLNISIRWWVAALSVSLVGGAILALLRINYMNELLSKDNINFIAIFVHLLLSTLCIGRPLWFAWISTSQISYRFKLSEDYSFKSSVAKAYEGYRREAAEIDDAFIHRLFGSALDRLDQEPMRVMEQKTPSSPFHDLIESSAFKNALDKFPDLNSVYRNIFSNKKDSKEKSNQDDDLIGGTITKHD